MKPEKLEDKISEIEYRVKLDEIAYEKARYNYKYSDLLNYSPLKISKLKSDTERYSAKLERDTHSLDALRECYEAHKNVDNSVDTSYLFRCTLPYEKVDPITSYQTTLTVKENVASLFANGISYKDVLPCIESQDIIDIESKYASEVPLTSLCCDNVKVEYIDSDPRTNCSVDTPVIARLNDTKQIGVIASSQIPVCYSFGEATYKDFDGNEYQPETPKLGDVCEIQRKSFEKEKNYYQMVNLEETVKTKMQASYDKMVNILDSYDNQ